MSNSRFVISGIAAALIPILFGFAFLAPQVHHASPGDSVSFWATSEKLLRVEPGGTMTTTVDFAGCHAVTLRKDEATIRSLLTDKPLGAICDAYYRSFPQAIEPGTWSIEISWWDSLSEAKGTEFTFTGPVTVTASFKPGTAALGIIAAVIAGVAVWLWLIADGRSR